MSRSGSISIQLISMIFTMIGDLGFVATLTNLGIFIGYFFVNMSLIMVRIKQPKVKGAFRAPVNIGNFPVLAAFGAATCFIMFFYFDPIIVLGEFVVIGIGYLLFMARKKI